MTTWLKPFYLAQKRNPQRRRWRLHQRFNTFCEPNYDSFRLQEDQNDEDFNVLREDYEILSQSVDQDGKKMKIVKLPMHRVVSDRGERLLASYSNSYIGNQKVLVPIFEHKKDEKG